MAYPVQGSLNSARILNCPGKLKSAHLAAVVGVKSLAVFRELAGQRTCGGSAKETSDARTSPETGAAGEVLWVDTAA